ncbi:MAG: ABC transporter substrate-binding protein [Lachnospiraceae bacterium]|nr:ABC transporter substrate-binding protein [Lachnospiraceae bacterium]
MKKKIVSLLLTIAMLTAFSGCGSTQTAADGAAGEDGKAQTAAAAADGETFTVGVCNYVDHASLNQIVDNLEEGLSELGKENGVTFEVKYDNCNADANVMDQIIANFIADDVDLMVGVATPVAMAMQAATEDSGLPVVFAAVSDPVSVKLVDSMEAPGANITGTSDFLDSNAVMNLIFAANPDAKKIGLLYDVGQDSSATPIEDARKYLDEKGVSYVERTGTTADEVALAAEALVADGVDAVFTPTDNTIMNAQLAIYETFADAQIPHYTGADSFALNGAFLGYGVDYAKLGTETAQMVSDILVGGKKPAEMPVRTFDNGTATINTEICEAIGFDLSDIKAKFEPFCTRIEEIKTGEVFE